VSERVAVVTGGGSGIGRAVALALAADGFAVALAGRRLESLEETAALGAAGGATMLAVTTDVRDPASVAALFDAVLARFGRVDLLFNNAGVGVTPSRLEDLAYEDWQRVIDTNVTGSFLCAQRAVAAMLAQTPRGGRIINNGSLSAHVPRPRAAPYTASKHAITGLTRSIALDYRDRGIACGQIDIGNAATAIAEQMAAGVEQANGEVRPEPTIDPADVARAVSYMASLPLDTNVLFLNVMATGMPFVGRG
jgi:NAD(P)-dependent dehydrogenase (short-subunit alcohol dehydrogenase family)